jgi:hypothetical protein
VVQGVTVFEVVLAGFTAWALARSGLAGYGEGARASVAMVAAMGVCLVLLVFVLAVWQWRLGPAARLRILLVSFGSLVWCFCALGWHDIAVASSRMPKAEPQEWLTEQSLAAVVALAALVLGVAIVGVLVWRECLRLKLRGQESTMNCVQ